MAAGQGGGPAGWRPPVVRCTREDLLTVCHILLIDMPRRRYFRAARTNYPHGH
jgi:hypothetical protein